MIVVYLNTDDRQRAKITTCNTHQEINNLLFSKSFHVVRANIGEFVYDIYCDVEGALKEHCKPSAFNKEGKAVLFGNLIFSKTDVHGDNVDLTIEEIGNLSDYFYQYFDLEYGLYTIIYGVEYG